MAMPGYAGMMEAGMPEQGMEATPVGNREGADAYRQRAMSLHQQLVDLEKQYGTAAIIPRNVAQHVHRLKQELDSSINQWQELNSRADTETDLTDSTMQAFSGNQSRGALLAPDRPPGQNDTSITGRMDQRASGMKSLIPGGGTPAPARPKMGPGGTKPQFGSTRPY